MKMKHEKYVKNEGKELVMQKESIVFYFERLMFFKYSCTSFESSGDYSQLSSSPS